MSVQHFLIMFPAIELDPLRLGHLYSDLLPICDLCLILQQIVRVLDNGELKTIGEGRMINKNNGEGSLTK